MHANDKVCYCKNVTVQDIKDAIDNGATTVNEVKEVTGAATACTKCISTVKEVVEDLLK
ncbi:MAG: (2Fe-2S)-binding protein [Paraclostridium sp.]